MATVDVQSYYGALQDILPGDALDLVLLREVKRQQIMTVVGGRHIGVFTFSFVLVYAWCCLMLYITMCAEIFMFLPYCHYARYCQIFNSGKLVSVGFRV
jgi:hypothetical protein